MRALRRLLRIVALVGTLFVGIIAVALIVSQTAWFRDWLRRYVVRESKQYLNGELSIGGLGGNLFFGLELSDVALDLSGQRVVAVKDLELDYSIFRILSSGVILDEIKLNQPRVVLERNAQGWNLARVVKEQQKEADREGPGRPLSLGVIEITDGRMSIRDEVVGTSGVRLPREIHDLDVKAGFEYEPVHYSLQVDHLSFTSPAITLEELSGKVAVRDDDLHLESVKVATAESNVRLDGVIQQYVNTPVVNLTTTGSVSLPEMSRIFPAAGEYRLHPVFDIKAEGPAERLALELDVRTQAGNVRGEITADVKGPGMGADGELRVEQLNLAPLLRDPAQQTEISGVARIDLDVAARPEHAPVLERMTGTFSFKGPRVVAAGYRAGNIDVDGRFDGRRITIDGRAAAYGGTATARGFIALPSQGRRLSLDLRGRANDVDLRALPAATGAPDVETDLSVASYHVRGTAGRFEGNVKLNRSSVEGATIADGAVASFDLEPRAIGYAFDGSIAELDLQRLGRAFEIPALNRPEYASSISGTFDVKGSVPRTPPGARREPDSALAEMTLEASGVLRNSEIMGGRLPELTFQTSIADGALQGSANGRFEGFDPARVASQPNLKGDVTGTVDATFAIADLTEPITPEAVRGSGTATLADSTVGGLKIEALDLEAAYENQVADVRQFTLTGPDVKATVSGRVALDQASTSNLQYRVEAVNLSELARLAGQEGVAGSAIVEGTVTGNRSALTTKGKLDGSNLSYNDNGALDIESQYTVMVPELDMARARVEATSEGTFIVAGALEISQLRATTTYEQKTIEFTTHIKERTRELDARGSVILHPDHQEVHLPHLAVRTQGIEWRTTGGEAAVQYGQDRVEIENLNLASGDQSLTVNGTIALKGEAPSAVLDVTAKNVDLTQLETLLLQDRGFTGTLSANARISGTASAPAVDGHVEIHQGGFQNYRYESLVADVDYDAQRVSVDLTLRQSATEQITATGSVPTSLFRRSETGEHIPPTAGEEVDLHIKSTALGLGVIQGFTTQVANVTGTVEADVRVTGSGDDPHLTGHIDIRDGAFGVPLGGVSYSGLNTRIDLTPDVARIQSFQILDEHGEALNVSGELAVHEKKVGAVNIALQSDNFEVIDNELGDVGVDADLRITGELRRPKVEGSVKLEAARLEVDRILTMFYDPYATEAMPEVVSAERQVEGSGSALEATNRALRRAETSAAPPGAEEAPGVEPPAPTGIAEAIELDVRLVIPDNLVLRGDDLRPGGPTGAALGDINMTVGGDLRVRKAPGDQVRLIGSVQTVRGTYEFQGRRFNLSRKGELRFVGDAEINPMLDVTATRVIPNTGVEATIRVTGTAKAPELALSSNPPLEESDILALIVFNRPVNELGTGERSSLAATAGGIATGFIAAPLGESIGRALDLDLFEITTQSDGGELAAGLRVGQQIGDRAFLSMRQEFGDRSTSEFMLEYQLARFLRLQATAAPETAGGGNRLNQRRVERAGLDLIFFFSY